MRKLNEIEKQIVGSVSAERLMADTEEIARWVSLERFENFGNPSRLAG
jgi:hypothetical protein